MSTSAIEMSPYRAALEAEPGRAGRPLHANRPLPRSVLASASGGCSVSRQATAKQSRIEARKLSPTSAFF
jgi:hypothetical protein